MYLFKTKLSLASLTCALLFSGSQQSTADSNYTLTYDKPASNESKQGSKDGPFIQNALPLGNGRLGTMFSGNIAIERLMMNEITLWGNTSRGLDEIKQSGSRLGAGEHLEKVIMMRQRLHKWYKSLDAKFLQSKKGNTPWRPESVDK